MSILIFTTTPFFIDFNNEKIVVSKNPLYGPNHIPCELDLLIHKCSILSDLKLFLSELKIIGFLKRLLVVKINSPLLPSKN